MPVSIPSGGSGSDDSDALKRTIRGLQDQLDNVQSQLNTAPGYYSPVSGKVAKGVPPGSLNARTLSTGAIAISMADKNGFGQEAVIGGPAPPVTYLSLSAGSGPPNTGEFPTTGNYGWYKDNVSGDYYFALNDSGNVVFQDLSTFTGTISDTQHGARGGGTLHAAATTSVAGFLSAANKTTYDNTVTTVGTLNTKVTDITSTGTPSNILNCTSLYVDGVPVILQRASATANSTDTSNAATQLNSLLASLRVIGIIAP